jgi:group I intron endonuclease
MEIAGIYQIQSKRKPNRVYIGSASNIQQRWRAHLSYLRNNKHHAIKLQRHFNKYGEDDFQFSILLGCDKDKEYLLKTEQFFIDSMKPYFNSCPLATSRKGSKATEETCKKISEALIGNQWCVGIKHDESFCKKSSENRKRNWQDPEYRRKVSEGLKRSHRERGKNNNSIEALRKYRENGIPPEVETKRLNALRKAKALKKELRDKEKNAA